MRLARPIPLHHAESNVSGEENAGKSRSTRSDCSANCYTALDAVETIVDCVDLDGKQLLLMSYVPLLTERQEGWYDSLSSLAYDKGLHKVLIKTLSALLSSLERPNIAFAVKIENITLIRSVGVCSGGNF